MKRTLLTGLVIGAVVALGLTLGCRPAVETVTVETIPSSEPDVNEPPTPVPADDLKAIVEANNHFGIELYKKLAETEKGNIFFSPYSIHAALSMTYAGARGETAAQMAKVLGIEKLGDRVHPAHAELARKLKSDGGKDKPEFNVANGLWGQRGLQFQPEFLSLTKRHYGGGFRELDFAKNTEGSRQTINKWVSEQTREKIPELIHKGGVTPSTALVLANAVYFKGQWAAPFQKGRTIQDKFWVAPDKTVDVPMMRTTIASAFYTGDGVKIVMLPYQRHQHSMIVVVPDAIDGLQNVVRNLISEQLRVWLSGLQAGDVHFTFPKFRVSQRYGLSGGLAGLGMPLAFGSEAEFQGITTQAKFKLEQVIHEAVVEVDEDGTVAAAATAVTGDRPISNPRPRRNLSLIVDRPFLFFIIQNSDKAVLFGGAIAHPSIIK